MKATDLIEQARLDRGLSLRAAGASANISDKYWRDAIKGAPVPEDTLARMALAVGLGPTDFNDPERPSLPDFIADLTPAYEASVEMRHRIGRLARGTMTDHGLDTYRDLAKAAGVRASVAGGFLKGDPWPTSPQLNALCLALQWDDRAVEELIWSGKDPNAVTAANLSTTHTQSPGGAGADADPEWRSEVEARLSRLEQALADYLEHPTTAEAAQVLSRFQDPPAPAPHHLFDLAADEKRNGPGR